MSRRYRGQSSMKAHRTARLEILGNRSMHYSRGFRGEFTVQVTHVRLGHVEGFVREARRASSQEHFMLSSNGNRIGREVLELAAPPDAWDAIADAVRTLDHLKRPVIRHAQWTPRTAPLAYERAEQPEQGEVARGA